MNASDSSNYVEPWGNVSTITLHPKTMDNGAMVAATAKATGIGPLRPSLVNQPSWIQASLV